MIKRRHIVFFFVFMSILIASCGSAKPTMSETLDKASYVYFVQRVSDSTQAMACSDGYFVYVISPRKLDKLREEGFPPGSVLTDSTDDYEGGYSWRSITLTVPLDSLSPKEFQKASVICYAALIHGVSRR